MADYKPNFTINLTQGGNGFSGSPSSIGDTSGSGVKYEFILKEYPNDMALTRNMGPTRPGGMVGGTGIKILKSSDRKTGKIGLALAGVGSGLSKAATYVFFVT